jgi:hypothetical protein
MFEILEQLWHIFFVEEETPTDAKEYWSNLLIEDGRTLMLGFGRTEEASKRSLAGTRSHRDILVDSTGLLKIIMPAEVHDSQSIPPKVIKMMSEHFGVEDMFNSSTDEPEIV